MTQPVKKILIALAVLAGAFFLACDPADVSPNPENAVTASIDNVVYKSSSVTANLFVNSSSNDSTLEITSVDFDGSSIDLSVRYPTTGTFTYSSTGPSDISMTYKKASNGITVSETTLNGQISISSFNSSTKKVSGTFSFVTDESTITDGVLNNVSFD